MPHFAVLSFDVDGTLGYDDLLDQFLVEAERLGLQPDRARRALVERWLIDFFGSGQHRELRARFADEAAFWQAHNRQLLERFATVGAIDAAVAPLTEALLRVETAITPVEGVADVLGRLRAQGYRLAIITNRGPRVARLLTDWNVAELFDIVVHRETVARPKPDPAPFVHVAERLGVVPAEVLHVGDDPYADVVGARAAGAVPLLIDRTGLLAPDWDVAAIRTLGELETWLERER